MEFTVKLDRFEGPYTKLIELIEVRKLSITEVTLASLADDYIAYVQTIDTKNMVDVSQFIVVASTLMLMKAKSLLPNVVYTEEEEKEIHDLEFKLELYKLLSEGEEHIHKAFGVHPLYSRSKIKGNDLVLFVPDNRVNQAMLYSIATLTLATLSTQTILPQVVVQETIKLEKVIEGLLARISSTSDSVGLSSLVDDSIPFEEKKKMLIVNFIAILELIRHGSIEAHQHDNDILIKNVSQEM